MKILLTGATGYVGGRLLIALQKTGIRVRCLARHPQNLMMKVESKTEVVAGDMLDPTTLGAALEGIHTAYYLVHSMGSRRSFEEQDREAASNFALTAHREGLKRIIYLGGLGVQNERLSPHLRSRHEVGEILRSSGVPVIEFRASVIIGSGSLSFEMIRALVERLPILVTPRWVSVPAQPIAIKDVIEYLIQALRLPEGEGRIFEIGGPDVTSYGGIMREYARQRGLRRVMIPVPVLTPRLSSLWLGLVTPLYARVGRRLITSIRHSTVVQDDSALHLFKISRAGIQEAIAAALAEEDREFAQTRWSDALSSGGVGSDRGAMRFGNRIVQSLTRLVHAPPDRVFRVIQRIGGKTGWYYADSLWRFRGFLDLLVGGVGMRRRRRHPQTLRAGDVVDCWRVESIESGRHLKLFSEMRLPGRAWLEFEVASMQSVTWIRQTIIFDPIGLFGLNYWYLLYPIRTLIFKGMLRGIARAAEAVALPS